MTKLRRDALAVLHAGLKAIRTQEAVENVIHLKKTVLTVKQHRFDLNAFDHVYVIGFGKASLEAAQALEKILGSRITDGVVLDVKHAPLQYIKSFAGTHPFPSEKNRRATGKIVDILKGADSHDLIITIVSGGGSALLCQPYQLTCANITLITKAMMARGATIQELNTVRKHLSEILGGQFARMAHPATVLGLIFSDVPGDDLDMIASGPTVMDTTTVADAKRIMKRYDILKACRLPDCALRETPKDPIYFQRVTNALIVSNKIALHAMRDEAKKRGYTSRLYSHALTGEARDIGRLLAGLPNPGEMVFAAGETTVTITGKGKGGRNQEVALGALSTISDDTLVLSCASDGIDNTPAAGAIADRETKRHVKQKKLDVDRALVQNASYRFFQQSGDQIVTGITGANVSDLMIATKAVSR